MNACMQRRNLKMPRVNSLSFMLLNYRSESWWHTAHASPSPTYYKGEDHVKGVEFTNCGAARLLSSFTSMMNANENHGAIQQHAMSVLGYFSTWSTEWQPCRRTTLEHLSGTHAHLTRNSIHPGPYVRQAKYRYYCKMKASTRIAFENFQQIWAFSKQHTLLWKTAFEDKRKRKTNCYTSWTP